MEHPNAASRHLQAISNYTSFPFQLREKNTLLLVLPDGGKVNTALAKVPPRKIILNGSMVILYTVSEFQDFALDITSVGMHYEDNDQRSTM